MSGELTAGSPTDNLDGTTTWSWSEDDPTATYLVTASNGDFDYEQSTAGGVPIYTAIDSTGTDTQKATAQANLARTQEMMNFLRSSFDPFKAEMDEFAAHWNAREAARRRA